MTGVNIGLPTKYVEMSLFILVVSGLTEDRIAALFKKKGYPIKYIGPDEMDGTDPE